MTRAGSRSFRNSLFACLLAVALPAAGLLLVATSGTSADVPQRSILMSDTQVSAVASYTLSFNLSAAETLGSIKLEFCSNDPIVNDTCTPPSGFDVSSATLTGQNGETGFSVYAPGTDANTLVLSRPSALTTATTLSYVFNGVVNPDTIGSFYGRLQTYASNDASGLENDHGGIALSVNSAIQVTTEVPPYLLFCGAVTIGGFDCSNASGSYINFGNVTTGGTASASSQLLTATNANSGFTISVFGSTMTSGNNTIPPINPQDVSRPGLGQFGLNLVANTTPLVGANPTGPGSATPAATYNQQNFFRFVSGASIASAASADDFRKLTASYIINIPVGQPIGVYATTLTYVCLANF